MTLKDAGDCFLSFFYLFSLPVAAQQTLLYEKKPPSEEQYVAKETRLDHFFDALAGKLDMMIITSEAVKKKKISGTFDLSDPQAALSRMLKTMALVSYRENRTLYIYNSNEVESSMLALNTVTRSELTAFLQQTGLFDARYPLKSDLQQQILYITAPPRYMSLIRSAVDALEAQYSVQEQGMNPEDEHIQLVKLENSFVQDREITSRGKSQVLPGVASALRELLNGGTAAKTGLIPRDEEQAQALPAETVWLGGERIRIVPLQGENSLLLKGNRNALNLINQLIKQLDVAKPQIELSLWIIDVSKNEADQLGINWQADYGGGKMKVAFNLSELNQFTGFSFFSKIRALSAKGQANMVSRPIILTQDNTPAVFDNNTTFYTTLLGERVSSLESITYGTKVSVTPRIANQRKSVEMIIELEDGAQKKEIAESNGEGALPVINRTNISTIARVAQGNTLLIGGYTRENTHHHKDKVPLLGDIPLAGRLFQFESVKTEKMVRLFLLQPRILQQDFFSDTEVTGHIPFSTENKQGIKMMQKLKQDY
ncbi:EscC/YscC/HrcC family type III secretion system outer membrane ring protein [Morganella psychrotolerans]|uniref:Type 3 secretion system secretin n=1 Tax=Morganella psychrotolerans TaxID=368603 RepID=A0A1B8HLV5_9GAMM|nr:EscC/YscC/HrcC family type III secretion system outer membrane ring protein [Morganella psychrotolerans]